MISPSLHVSLWHGVGNVEQLVGPMGNGTISAGYGVLHVVGLGNGSNVLAHHHHDDKDNSHDPHRPRNIFWSPELHNQSLSGAFYALQGIVGCQRCPTLGKFAPTGS